MKIFVTGDEMYPVYTEAHGFGSEIEISEAELAEWRAAMQSWYEWQSTISERVSRSHTEEERKEYERLKQKFAGAAEKEMK